MDRRAVFVWVVVFVLSLLGLAAVGAALVYGDARLIAVWIVSLGLTLVIARLVDDEP